MIDSAGDAWTLVGRVRAFIDGPRPRRHYRDTSGIAQAGLLARARDRAPYRGEPPSPFTQLRRAAVDPAVIEALASIASWWDPTREGSPGLTVYVPNPADPFAQPPLRPAPDTLPSSPFGVTGPFVDAHQQAAWWTALRRSADNSPDARRNARAWGAHRDAVEPAAGDELRAVIGALNLLDPQQLAVAGPTRKGW